MLVQPPTGFVFVEFCKFWNTWFWHDFGSLVPELRLEIWLPLPFIIGLLDLLEYSSGVGGVVLIYHPHCGDSVPVEPTILLSADPYLPYGLVGMMSPFPAVLGFMFGMYLDCDADEAAMLSWSESSFETCRTDRLFRRTDLVGFW